MGDFKVHCQIELDGHKYDSYLNWPPDEVHPDVIDWLERTWRVISDKIKDDMYSHISELREKEKRKQEYDIYIALKKKFEG